MKRPISAVLCVTIALAGCATSSTDIASNYVSPMQFQTYDCDQLASETQRIQSRVKQLSGRLDEAASNDKAILGIGLILFWPALFALGGTKQQEADYARLKGEYDAIQQSAVAKKCPGIAGSTASTRSVPLPNSIVTQPSVAGTPAAPQTTAQKLTDLKRLHEAGLISTEVYVAQQKVILSN